MKMHRRRGSISGSLNHKERFQSDLLASELWYQYSSNVVRIVSAPSLTTPKSSCKCNQSESFCNCQSSNRNNLNVCNCSRISFGNGSNTDDIESKCGACFSVNDPDRSLCTCNKNGNESCSSGTGSFDRKNYKRPRSNQHDHEKNYSCKRSPHKQQCCSRNCSETGHSCSDNSRGSFDGCNSHSNTSDCSTTNGSIPRQCSNNSALWNESLCQCSSGNSWPNPHVS